MKCRTSLHRISTARRLLLTGFATTFRPYLERPSQCIFRHSRKLLYPGWTAFAEAWEMMKPCERLESQRMFWR